jgi:hypothetical protein
MPRVLCLTLATWLLVANQAMADTLKISIISVY